MQRLGVVLLLACSCARLLPGGMRCPAHGGPTWREYRSRHFVLDTDLGPPEAADLVHKLETLQAMEIRALVGEDRDIPGYVRVIVPADERTFETLAPLVTIGYFGIGPLGESTAVIHPAALREDPEVIAHELAHHLVWYIFPRQPLWFNEGLAQFVQTIANPKFRGTVGLVPQLRAPRLRSIQQMPAREILSWRGGHATNETDREELWSWVLYHWLWNERPREFADYQRRLATGEDPAAAWLASFPEFDPADRDALKKLDAALDKHRKQGEMTFFRVEANPDTAFTQEIISSARVHMLLLGIRRRWGEDPRFYGSGIDPAISAHYQIEEALREDPTEPVAIWLSDRFKGETRVSALRKAAAARPYDWRAWYLLALTLEHYPDRAEREAVLRKAVSLNTNSAPAQTELASHLLALGRAEEALPFARRAVTLAPSRPTSLDTLAAVAAALDACPEALSLERRAVDLLSEDDVESGPRERLRALELRCGR